MSIKKIKEADDQFKIGYWRSIFNTKPWDVVKFAISMPFVYGLFIPALIFHFFLELYHQVSFRLYGIPIVKASDYFSIDRGLLPYLNWLEKINCLYCGYVNGMLAFALEIGTRTERYWCPIKHERKVQRSHSEYANFVDYSDAAGFRKKQQEFKDFPRDKLRKQEK